MSAADRSAPMLLSRLQGGLERCYDVSLPYAVDDFVSHDARWFQATTGQPADNDEVLLVQQQEEGLGVTLYLENATLDMASNAMRSGELHSDALDSVCTVVEGVSHVVCLLWHAHHERQISAFDLELQADVDKFVLLASTLAHAEDRRALHERLFERVNISAPAGSALHERYRVANDQAACYCQWLNATFMNPRNRRGLQCELARFYRLSGLRKRERIRTASH